MLRGFIPRFLIASRLSCQFVSAILLIDNNYYMEGDGSFAVIQSIFQGDLVWVDHEDGSSPGWGLVIGYREVSLHDHSANMVDFSVLFNGMVLQLSQTYLKRMCWYNKHLLTECSQKDGFQKRGT